ncbi:hypothetical protein Q3G72_023237 [Acer saccharum]|nr:hypothetical protein Q3G72_023237 [Acer saccharum]
MPPSPISTGLTCRKKKKKKMMMKKKKKKKVQSLTYRKKKKKKNGLCIVEEEEEEGEPEPLSAISLHALGFSAVHILHTHVQVLKSKSIISSNVFQVVSKTWWDLPECSDADAWFVTETFELGTPVLSMQGKDLL